MIDTSASSFPLNLFFCMLIVYVCLYVLFLWFLSFLVQRSSMYHAPHEPPELYYLKLETAIGTVWILFKNNIRYTSFEIFLSLRQPDRILLEILYCSPRRLSVQCVVVKLTTTDSVPIMSIPTEIYLLTDLYNKKTWKSKTFLKRQTVNTWTPFFSNMMFWCELIVYKLWPDTALHGLFNCEIGGLDCHVITTEYRTRFHCIHM